MGQIVRPTTDPFGAAVHRPAPQNWLTELAQSTPAGVQINAAGETLPDPQGLSWAGLSPFREPYAVSLAKQVQAGMVWVDYTGWPMYREETLLASTDRGPSGFQDFLNAAGIPLAHTFETVDPSGLWPYPRSLQVLGPLPSQFVANPYALHSHPYYASFALRIGSGWYIYAYGTDSPGSDQTYGVEPAVVAQFLRELLAGQFDTYGPPAEVPQAPPTGPGYVTPEPDYDYRPPVTTQPFPEGTPVPPGSYGPPYYSQPPSQQPPSQLPPAQGALPPTTGNRLGLTTDQMILAGAAAVVVIGGLVWFSGRGRREEE